jgi:hypothetical protein
MWPQCGPLTALRCTAHGQGYYGLAYSPRLRKAPRPSLAYDEQPGIVKAPIRVFQLVAELVS